MKKCTTLFLCIALLLAGASARAQVPVPEITTPVYAGDAMISGTGEPGATIYVTWSQNMSTSAIATVTTIVSTSGSWAVAVPSQTPLQRDNSLYATQTLPGQSQSDPSHTFVQDRRVSSRPLLPTTFTISDTVLTATEGQASESVVSVRFLIRGESYEAAQGDAGRWSLDLKAAEIYPLEVGEILRVFQKEQNKTESDPAITQVRTAEASPSPVIRPVQAGDTQIKVEGQVGAVVLLYFTEKTALEAAVGADGIATFNLAASGIAVQEGNTLRAYQMLEGQAESEAHTLMVGPSGISARPTIQSAASGDTQVMVEGEPGATITLTYNGDFFGLVGAGPDGVAVFDLELSGISLKSGDTLSATQTDLYQGESAVHTISVVSAAWREISEPPVIQPVSPDDTMVTIRGVPGARVTLRRGSEVLATGTVDGQGAAMIGLSDISQALSAGDVLSATQAEAEKEDSNAYTYILEGAVAPEETEQPTPKPTADPDATPWVSPTPESTFSAGSSPTGAPSIAYTNSGESSEAGQGAARVTGSSINLRAGPGKDYAAQGTISAPASVQVLESGLGDGREWSRIIYNGVTYYIHSSFLAQ